MAARGLFLLAGAIVLGSICEAQTVLRISNVSMQWPEITIGFQTECGGLPTFDVEKRNLSLWENGQEITNFSIDCLDTLPRCPISVALVFDCSGSMQGVGIEEAVVAGKSFVTSMDASQDEAAVVAFNSTARVVQNLTSDTKRLGLVIDSLVANGGTAMINGCYLGVEEIALKARNRCKAVVLLSDGYDNASWRTIEETAALAVSAGIRIYAVGLGRNIDTVMMKALATKTGGRFFEVFDPTRLSEVYRVIAQLAMRDTADCFLRYTASCTDGGERNLKLVLSEYCGGKDSATYRFTSPGNTGRFLPLTIRAAAGSVWEGKSLRIPIDLATALNGDVLTRGDLYVSYDASVLGDPVARDAGTLLSPNSVLVASASPGFAHVRLLRDHIVSGAGTLFELEFPTRDVSDTACTSVRITRVSFDEGCLRPTMLDGRACVIPCLATAELRPAGVVEICEGDSVLLRATEGFSSYSWFKDGTAWRTTGGNLIFVRERGNYHAEVQDTNGCTAQTTTMRLIVSPVRARIAGNASSLPMHWGGTARAPFIIDPSFEAGQDFAARLRISYNPEKIVSIKIDTAGCGWTGLGDIRYQRGIVDISVDGSMKDTTAPLFNMDIQAATRASSDTTMLLYEATMTTSCAGQWSVMHTPVIIDGFCDHVFLRKQQLSMQVSPNPAASLVTLQLRTADHADLHIRLRDAFGRVCRNVFDGVCSAGSSELPVDVADLPNGLYVIEAVSDKDMGFVSFVVMR